MTVGYDGYVTPGKPLQGCLLRLLVFDDNTGNLAAPYLDYTCNRTYLPGGGFVATKGHCYDTEMVPDSTVAEWYWWTTHSVCG